MRLLVALALLSGRSLVLRRGLLLSLGLLPVWGQPLSGQQHDHGAAAAASAPADPLLRVILGGPQVVLAHEGFLELTPDQVEALRPLAMEVCAGEVRHTRRARVALRALRSAPWAGPAHQHPAPPLRGAPPLSGGGHPQSGATTTGT